MFTSSHLISLVPTVSIALDTLGGVRKICQDLVTAIDAPSSRLSEIQPYRTWPITNWETSKQAIKECFHFAEVTTKREKDIGCDLVDGEDGRSRQLQIKSQVSDEWQSLAKRSMDLVLDATLDRLQLDKEISRNEKLAEMVADLTTSVHVMRLGSEKVSEIADVELEGATQKFKLMEEKFLKMESELMQKNSEISDLKRSLAKISVQLSNSKSAFGVLQEQKRNLEYLLDPSSPSSVKRRARTGTNFSSLICGGIIHFQEVSAEAEDGLSPARRVIAGWLMILMHFLYYHFDGFTGGGGGFLSASNLHGGRGAGALAECSSPRPMFASNFHGGRGAGALAECSSPRPMFSPPRRDIAAGRGRGEYSGWLKILLHSFYYHIDGFCRRGRWNFTRLTAKF